MEKRVDAAPRKHQPRAAWSCVAALAAALLGAEAAAQQLISPQFSIAVIPVTSVDEDDAYDYGIVVFDPEIILGDTVTITAPTLPAWLTLTNHGNDGFATATATLSGVPTQADVGPPHPVLLVASDGVHTVQQPFSITVNPVNDAPTAVADSYTTAEDTTLTVAAPGVLGNDSDPDSTPTAVLDTNVSNGTLTLNANGSFTYVPNPNFNGSDSFTYHASDGSLSSNTVTVSITVTPVNDAPTATADSYTTAEDTTLNVTSPGVLGNDSDPDSTPTAVLDTNVSNGTLNLNANGSFTYVPNANFNGADSFTYHASDGSLSSNTVTVSITVTAVNDAPVAVPDGYTTAEDTTLNVAAPGVLGNDSDLDSGTITAVLGTGVSSGTLTLNANGSFSYVPNANFSGADSFTYRANDGSLSSNLVTVNITVTAVDDPPTAVANSYTTAEDTTLSVTAPGVLGNDTDPDPGTTLTAVLDTNVSNGTLNLNANGSFTYVPNANYNGPDSFTYHASDGTLSSNTVTVSITVTAVNDAPTAVADSYATAEDTTLNVAAPGVLGNDTDPDSATLTAVLNATTANGTLTLNANGSFSYVPNANFNGTDSFTYRANDGSLSSSAVTVSITVTPVDDPPTAVPNSYTTAEDTTLNVAAPGVLGNDTDPDSGTTLTAVLDTNVSNGTLTLNANGSFSYVPNADFNGADSFTYHASDGSLSSNVVTVSITVTAVNDAPTAAAESYTTAEDTTLNVAAPGVLANDTDPDSATLTAVLNATTANGTLTLNANGSFSYVPNANFNGTDSFRYRANDGSLASNVVTVTITISPVNDAPFLTNTPPAAVNEDSPYTYTAVATDPDGDPLTFAAPTLPSWLAFTAPATIAGVPTQDDIGPHNVTMTISDGLAPAVQHSFTITVISVDDAPVIAPIPEQVATELVPFSLNLADFVTDEDTPLNNLVYASTGPLPAGLTLGANGILSGTPALDASVGDFTVSFTVSDASSTVPAAPPFNLTVLRAGRADLELSLAAAPNPVPLNTTATWTFTITNNAPQVDVGGIALQAVFAGEVPFLFDNAIAGCTVAPSGAETHLSCTLGALEGGATTSVALRGRGGFQGDVFASASVAIAGPVPIDETPRNDTATASLGVAQNVSTAPAQTIGGLDARAAAAGDLNGDGFVDLAVVTGPGQSTAVLLNVVDPGNANKRALSTVPLTLGDQAAGNGIVLVDLDGDSHLDIVTATGPGGANGIFLNSGVATFTALTLGNPAEDSRAVAAGDIDGDLLIDLVFANGSPSPVYTNQGAGNFVRTALLGNADSRGVVLVDLFGDALPELVFANADGDATVYGNTGGVFQLALTLPTGPTTSVAAADFNNDGRFDLLFGRSTGATPATAPSNLVWLNTSGVAGSFFVSDELGASSTKAVVAADVDLDGDADAFTINDNGSHKAYINVVPSSGAFALHPQQIGRAGVAGAAVGTFSVDARIDVALVGPDGVAVFYNDGAGNFGSGDVTGPTIQLLGQPSITLTVEDTYVDAGATATDTIDGDVTARIVVDNPVNPAVIGTYTVTYSATDLSGNSAAPVTRTVRVQARQGTGGSGGGAAGLEFALFLAFVAVLGRLHPRWRRRSNAS